MTFCDMDMLYKHTNCVFHRKLSFSMHFSLIENLHFHFIRNYDRVSNWLKSCDRSIFSLHMHILDFLTEVEVWSRDLTSLFKLNMT